MNETELIEQISIAMGKTKVIELSNILLRSSFDIDQLIALTFHKDKTIGFRAAWLLEIMFMIDQCRFVSHTSQLIDKIKEITNPSCQRHYAKILMHITSPKSPEIIKRALNDINLEPAVEQCFDWMIDPKVPVAVKAHAAEALFNMHTRYPWIADELINQLQFLMRDGTAAIQTRGKRLISNLQV